MKKIMTMLLCLLVLCQLAGCSATQEEPTQPVQIGNPWTQWASIPEAEAAVGFSFGLPEVVADCYIADEFSTMNAQLLEVTYHSDALEVCVRKQAGEGEDISGDYNEYASCQEMQQNGAQISVHTDPAHPAVKILVSCQGYSWAVLAPDGFVGDSCQDFLNLILP